MDKELAIRLGKAARAAREALQLTQEQLAESLDVSTEFYGRIERGTTGLSIEVFVRMMSVLKVSADVLLGLEAAPATEPVPLLLPEDPPELHALVPLLEEARPSVLRLVNAFLREAERAQGGPDKATQSRKRPTKKPPSTSSPGKGDRKPRTKRR